MGNDNADDAHIHYWPVVRTCDGPMKKNIVTGGNKTHNTHVASCMGGRGGGFGGEDKEGRESLHQCKKGQSRVVLDHCAGEIEFPGTMPVEEVARDKVTHQSFLMAC